MLTMDVHKVHKLYSTAALCCMSYILLKEFVIEMGPLTCDRLKPPQHRETSPT